MASHNQSPRDEEVDRLQAVIQSLEQKLGYAEAGVKSLQQSLFKRAIRDVEGSLSGKDEASQPDRWEAEIAELKEELATVCTALDSSQRLSKVAQDALQAQTDRCLRLEEQQRSALETIASLVSTAESSRQALEKVTAKGKDFLQAISETHVAGQAPTEDAQLIRSTLQSSQPSGWSFAQNVSHSAPPLPQTGPQSKPLKSVQKRKVAPESCASSNVPSRKRRAPPSPPTSQNVASPTKKTATAQSALQPLKRQRPLASTSVAGSKTMPPFGSNTGPFFEPSTYITHSGGYPPVSAFGKPDTTAAPPKKLLSPNTGTSNPRSEQTVEELLQDAWTKAATDPLPPNEDNLQALQLRPTPEKEEQNQEIDWEDD